MNRLQAGKSRETTLQTPDLEGQSQVQNLRASLPFSSEANTYKANFAMIVEPLQEKVGSADFGIPCPGRHNDRSLPSLC